MASSQANAEIGIGYCPTITAAAGMEMCIRDRTAIRARASGKSEV